MLKITKARLGKVNSLLLSYREAVKRHTLSEAKVRRLGK
jgi:hypothetical protein